MTLGQRIQELRKEQNLSQEALGAQLGVSRQAVSRWEMDGAVPDIDNLIVLSRLFGVSLNELLQVEDTGEGPQPQIVLAAPRHSRWTWVLVLLLALSLMSCAMLGWQTAALTQRLTALEAQTDPVSLDPSAPLVADVQHSIDYYSNGMVDLTVTLTAAQVVPEMKVTLQITDGNGKTTLKELSPSGGSVYSVRFPIDFWNTPFNLSALFQDSSGLYTQQILTLTSISQNSHTWESPLDIA